MRTAGSAGTEKGQGSTPCFLIALPQRKIKCREVCWTPEPALVPPCLPKATARVTTAQEPSAVVEGPLVGIPQTQTGTLCPGLDKGQTEPLTSVTVTPVAACWAHSGHSGNT